MARLHGGAAGWAEWEDPPGPLRPHPDDAREAVEAHEEIQRARRPASSRKRSRWERRYNASERCWEDVEVEVIPGKQEEAQP